MKPAGMRRQYQDFKANWFTLGFYQRFEQTTSLVLTALIAGIIVLAMWDLLREVVLLLAFGLFDPLNHKVFQLIFGQIMTVLIALEFKHSILSVVAGGRSIVNVRTVVLVGVLALSRKFIILEPDEHSAATLFALAAVLFVLGATYWLLRDRDLRADAVERTSASL